MNRENPAPIPIADAWRVKGWFPKIVDFVILEPCDWNYNCYAHAVGKDYWIGPGRFVLDLHELGYRELDECNTDVEPGVEKIAVYSDGDTVVHGAKQRRDGKWESKLGPGPLIIHNDLDCLMHGEHRYGDSVAIFARPLETAA